MTDRVINDRQLTRWMSEAGTFAVIAVDRQRCKIVSSDLDEPLLSIVREYVRDSQTLERGSYFGTVPSIELVSQKIVDTFKSDVVQAADESEQRKSSTATVGITLKSILQKALDVGSSDVHIEIYDNATVIYNRVDGRRILSSRVPEKKYGNEIISHIFMYKAAPRDRDYVEHLPNNGRIDEVLQIDKRSVPTSWRVSYAPTVTGGKLVMRNLDGEERRKLTELGWLPWHIETYRKVFNGPSGLILFAGKTNSGKTQAIAAGLDEISDERAVHTLEDPNEFSLGKPQTFVNPDLLISSDNQAPRKANFAYYTRLLLRHDLDVTMLSELRDHEGAMEACRNGETGQLVFSSLHCSSAIGIAPTLIEQFGVPSALVASPDLMRLWIYQTLVRTLCKHCKLTPSEAESRYSANNKAAEFQVIMKHLATVVPDVEQVRFRNVDGCEHCVKGESGRTAVVEMILFDDLDREYIQRCDYLGWAKHLRTKGFKSTRHHAYHKISQGEVDVETAAAKVLNLLPVKTVEAYEALSSELPITLDGEAPHVES
jgi:type II secretory ATPase GspE/PulE/Tfp pilus assembly ATPase PilB-like protein